MLLFSFPALGCCCVHTNGLINLSVGASCLPACHEICLPVLCLKPADRWEETSSRDPTPRRPGSPNWAMAECPVSLFSVFKTSINSLINGAQDCLLWTTANWISLYNLELSWLDQQNGCKRLHCQVTSEFYKMTNLHGRVVMAGEVGEGSVGWDKWGLL